MIGRITTALMALVSVKLITSTLWVEWYWVYATIYEFLGLFAVAGDFGIYTVALREMSSHLGNDAGSSFWSRLAGEESIRSELNKTKHKNCNSWESENIELNLDPSLHSGWRKNPNISFIYQNIMWMRIVLMILVMWIAIITAFSIPQYQWTLIPIWVVITAIAVFANLTFSMATSILQLHLKMEYWTYALVVGKIISVIMIAYWAFFTEWWSNAFFIFLWAWVIWHIIMLWMSLLYAKRYTEIIPKFDFDYWKEIFKKAAPYWVALILWTIYFKINVTFLSLLRSNEEVWIFAVWIRIIEVFTVLPIFFMNSILPSLAKEIEKPSSSWESTTTEEYIVRHVEWNETSIKSENYKNLQQNCNNWFYKNNYARMDPSLHSGWQLAEKEGKLHALLNFSFQFMLITGLPLVLGTHLISKEIITLVSSVEFVSWHKYALWWDFALELLIIAMFFSFFSNFISVCFVAFQKQNKVLFINLLWVIINVILNWIYIPKYGFPAAWVVSIISEAIIFISWFILFQQTYRFIPKFTPIIKTLLSWLLMFIVWYFTKQMIWEWLWQSLSIMIICWLVYGLAIWKSWALCKKDIDMIKREEENEMI